jgi:D-alanyl-D-alanine carboxypeptidase/D-alanyl-D-alanine-endopeptidase (penicillin-binding protein 4)
VHPGLVVACILAGALAAPADSRSGSVETVRLVWHVETEDGRPVDARDADSPINPASVTKVATSLWALERLGPQHRFETRFASSAPLDPATGVLDGDLVVLGSGDPDFHVENAYLVARALNDLGLRTVRGRLLVDETFWIGWEGGSEKRETNREQRATLMASRLRDALDPARWTGDARQYLNEFIARRGIADDAPRVVVEGAPGAHVGLDPPSILLRHRSSPLRRILKRFNAYSNNDIERLGRQLGGGEDLVAFLAARWKVAPSTLAFESLSGLGTNRMTPRLVVRLLVDFDETLNGLDLRLEDVLPAVGCDPGTLTHFPQLTDEAVGALVAKTGSLMRTDGGVAVLAGVAHTARGSMFFCVVAPGSGRRLAEARQAQQRWLLELIARHGGPQHRECGAAVGHSDDDARILP